jgi:hypothetical protein
MYNMILYLYVLIIISLHRESLKLILATNPLPRWFCHNKSWLGLKDLVVVVRMHKSKQSD